MDDVADFAVQLGPVGGLEVARFFLLRLSPLEHLATRSQPLRMLPLARLADQDVLHISDFGATVARCGLAYDEKVGAPNRLEVARRLCGRVEELRPDRQDFERCTDNRESVTKAGREELGHLQNYRLSEPSGTRVGLCEVDDHRGTGNVRAND